MRNKLYIVVITAFIASCATTKQYLQLPKTDDDVYNEAIIYVLRPAVIGAAIKFDISQNDRPIGELGPKSYLAWRVNLNNNSEIKITSKSENTDHLYFRPKSGEVYFIKNKVKPGVIKARTKLELINQQDGREILKKLKSPEVIKGSAFEENKKSLNVEVLYLKNGNEIHGTIITFIPNETITIKTLTNNIFVHEINEIKEMEINPSINKIVYLKNGSLIHGKIIEFELDNVIKVITSINNVFVYNMNDIEKITKSSE